MLETDFLKANLLYFKKVLVSFIGRSPPPHSYSAPSAVTEQPKVMQRPGNCAPLLHSCPDPQKLKNATMRHSHNRKCVPILTVPH